MGQGNKTRRRGGSGSHGHTGTKKHRGPRHGHGNKGKGGVNAYGSNNINMTIRQAKKIYANQLAAGYSLQEAMKHNKAETVRFSDLLDDQGDTKNANSTNQMAYQQTTKDDINQAYQEIFGRDASFGTLGGADYWADQMDNQGLSLSDLRNHLTSSAEGQSVTTDAQGNKSSWIGGVNPNQSIANSWTDNKSDWSDHFNPNSATPGGLSGDLTGTIWEGMAGAGTATNPSTRNVAGLLNATYNTNNPNSTLPNPYFQNDPITNDTVIPGGDGGTFGGTQAADGWWSQFADADAFKEFLQGGQQDDGMGDFMKFMMLMSVMGGGRGMGGGGGYGGSQYGYGGLNPGGVQAAYDPLQHLQGMGNWFKTNFGSGSGSGATTSTVNTGTTGN